MTRSTLWKALDGQIATLEADLFAKRLSETRIELVSTSIRAKVREATRLGMLTLSECGELETRLTLVLTYR